MIVDALFHVVESADESRVLDCGDVDWRDWVSQTIGLLDSQSVAKAGICVMDSSLQERPDAFRRCAEAISTERMWGIWMPALNSDVQRLKTLANAGFKGIIFHSYLQRIARADYSRVIDLGLAAAELGLVPGFCTAYGSRLIFDHESLPLVASFAKQSAAPTVLYHMGGCRVLEAFLLCDAWPQLILETSFSLPYWIGSSVEADMAFAIRKLGAARVMFGSDHPFVPLDRAIMSHRAFFQRHGIADTDQAMIMGGTAKQVFRV